MRKLQENQKLQAEVQNLLDELKNLQESFNSISNGGQASNTGQFNNTESEASTGTHFPSDKYVDFRQFQKQAQEKKLKLLGLRIAEISKKCQQTSFTIDAIQQYISISI